MPQLTAAVAKQAEANAWDSDGQGGFAVLEEGDYIFQLMEVKSSDQPGASGHHFWTWMFEHPETKVRIWENTSLAPQALGKLGQMFAAFGQPATTPTENLIGEYAGASVVKNKNPRSKNPDAWRNEALAFFPASELEDEYDPNVHGFGAAKRGGAAAAPADFGDDDKPKTARRRSKGAEGSSEEPF
jgi:hypothetical protein